MWRIQGDAMLEDINKILGLQLSDEEYDTFSGYVLDALGGSLPDDNESFELDLEDMIIKAKMGTEHRIDEAVVRLKPKPQKQNEEEND